MKLSGELIERFLAGRCSPEETSWILNALEEQPELLNIYVGKDDWDAIDHADTEMPQQVQQHIEQAVLSQTTKKKKVTFLTRHSRWLTAAASVVAMTGTWLLISQYKQGPSASQVTAGTDNPVHNNQPHDTLVSNNTNSRMRIVLQDGSVVMLGLHSTIKYAPRFGGQKREISLTGEAYFKVAKDRQKPFIVYSNGISTTALGTAFTIKAYSNNKEIKVALHEGKVVIKSTEAQRGFKKDIYLLPGDQLTVNIITLDVVLDKEPVKKESLTKSTAPLVEWQPVLVFDREPLANVFEQLSRQYHTTLSYDEPSLAGLSFTGKIQAATILEKVLQDISFLNDLKCTKTAQGYLISVSH